jgi:uncharacterized lipoprotein YmbA
MMRLTLAAILFLGACSILPAPRPVRYRTTVLDVEQVPGPARAAGAPPASVSLRAVALPTYLDTDSLVTRVGDNEIRYSKEERWGEPLATAVPRILAADLEACLAGAGVELRPAGTSADAWVDVTIHRFEADGGGATELRARWTVHRREGRAESKSGEARLVDVRPGSSAAGMSRLLGKLAEAIAADLRGAIRADQRPLGRMIRSTGVPSSPTGSGKKTRWVAGSAATVWAFAPG